MPVEALNGDLLAIIERMIEVNDALQSREKSMLTELMSDQASADEMAARVANLPEIVRTMLRHQALFARQTDVGIQLLARGALKPRDREIAVLRTEIGRAECRERGCQTLCIQGISGSYKKKTK